MGVFVIQRMFNFQNRILSTLAMRFEAKKFVRDIRQMVGDYKKLSVVEAQHDLPKIENLEKHMTDRGGDAVREAYALFTHDMLALDKVIKTLPDTELYIKYLDRVKEKYKESKEVVKAIETIKKNLKNARTEILATGKAELREVYNKLLNIIKATETQDRETFMQTMIDTWRRESTSYFDYWMIRREAKEEIKQLPRVKKERDNVAETLKLLRKWVNEKKLTEPKLKLIANKINTATENLVKHAKGAFQRGYRLAIRSIITLFTMIGYLNRLYKTNRVLADKHEIPIKMAEDMEKKISDIFLLEHKEAKEEVKEVHAVEEALK